MPKAIQNKIKQLLCEATVHYHRLVLLVGETGSGKTTVLRALGEDLGVEVINVNLTLSAKLIELTERQRALHISTLLGEILEKTGEVALLDNTEMLFDRKVKQDPVRLLQSLSRKCRVVASWNGRIVGGKLTYAETCHSECRTYDRDEFQIVVMNETFLHCPEERRRI